MGFAIDALPIAPEALEFAGTHNLDPLELSFYGGEEYELVVIIDPKHWRKAEEAITQVEGNLIKIGRATVSRAVFLKWKGKRVAIEARGYEHFKQKGVTTS